MTNTTKEYCTISIVYPRGKKLVPIKRYIPIEEMQDCYFTICMDDACPNLQRYGLHPDQMAGCKNRPYNHVCGCIGSVHLHGQHKRCVGNRKTRYHGDADFDAFVRKHTISAIPENEIVYHFDSSRFQK